MVKILQHGQVNTIPPLPQHKSSCTAGVFPLNLGWDEGACHSYTLASKSRTRTGAYKEITLPETNIAPENRLSQKERIFQASIFGCELLVSGRVVLLLDFYIDFHVPYKIREEHCENVLKALPIEKLN